MNAPLPDEPVSLLYTTRQYPCGCRAEGTGDVPAYCSEHGLPPELGDPLKVMERGRFLLGYIDDAKRYRWLRDHPGSTWEIGYIKPFRFVCRVPFRDLDAVPATLDAAIDAAMKAQHE